MTELVAVLSTGKGSWGHVARVIDGQDWEKIILITNEFGKEKFNANDKTELIVIDNRKGLNEIIEKVKGELEGKIKGPEVAVNIISGDGKEHTALLVCLMQLGVGFRLCALTNDGVSSF